MRHHKRMFRIFFITAAAFIVCIVTLLLWNDHAARMDAFRTRTSNMMEQMTEHADRALIIPSTLYAQLRGSEYTMRYQYGIQPDNYNRLKFHKSFQNACGLTVGDAVAAVTNFSDDIVLLQHNTCGVDYFLKTNGITRDQLDDMRNYFAQDARRQVYLNAAGDSRLFIVRSEISSAPSRLYLFVIYPDEMLIDIAMMDSQAESSAFAILYDDKVVRVSGALSDALNDAIINGAAPNGYMLTTHPAAAARFSYILLSGIPSPFAATTVIILLFGALLTGCAAMLIQIATRRLWMPVSDLLNLSGGGDTPTDEFAYIKKTLLSLRMGLQSFELSVEQSRRALEQTYLRDFLEGRPGDNRFLELTGGDSSVKSNQFVVILIRMAASDTRDETMTQDQMYFLLQNIESYMKPMMDGCEYARTTGVSFDTYVVVASTNEPLRLYDALKLALLSAEEDMGIIFHAAMSRSCSDVHELPNAYRRALRLLDEVMNNISGEVILREDHIPPHKNEAHAGIAYPLSLEQELASAIAHGQRELCQTVISELFDNNLRAEQLLPLADALSLTVNRLINQFGLSSSDIFSGANPRKVWLNAANTRQLRKLADEIISAIIDRVDEKRVDVPEGLRDKMIQFVSENYSRDISLIDLAEHLGLSQNYVSTLFKKAVGSNYKEYQNKIRFERAKAMLDASPSIRIREAAEAVGCNADILSRIFVKHMGVTPREYQSGKVAH